MNLHVIFLLIFLYFNFALAVKNIGEACDKEKNECGENAICLVQGPCRMGRCQCMDRNYRMKPPSSTQNSSSDCYQILNEGENCDNSGNDQFLPMFSQCQNGKVKCDGNINGVSLDGICDRKWQLAGDGCDLDGGVRKCDPSKGLICSSDRICKCPDGLLPLTNEICRTSSFGEKCSKDAECQMAGFGTSPSSTAALCLNETCSCNRNNSETPNFRTQMVIFPFNTSISTYESRLLCVRAPSDVKTGLGLMDQCIVPSVEAFSNSNRGSLAVPQAFCEWTLSLQCFHCPEDDAEFKGDMQTGKCRDSFKPDGYQGVSSFDSSNPSSNAAVPIAPSLLLLLSSSSSFLPPISIQLVLSFYSIYLFFFSDLRAFGFCDGN